MKLFLLTCKLASLHSILKKKRGAYWFQDNISQILHEHFFSNVIFNIFFFITTNWNNMQTQVHVHGSPLTHSSCHFVWPQIYLFLNIMHLVEPPPSHSSCPIPLHLWSTYIFDKDSPSSMFAWCKIHCSLWHHSRIFFCFQSLGC